jgi:hypothetical protein
MTRNISGRPSQPHRVISKVRKTGIASRAEKTTDDASGVIVVEAELAAAASPVMRLRSSADGALPSLLFQEIVHIGKGQAMAPSELTTLGSAVSFSGHFGMAPIVVGCEHVEASLAMDLMAVSLGAVPVEAGQWQKSFASRTAFTGLFHSLSIPIVTVR